MKYNILPFEPAKTANDSPQSISEGGRVEYGKYDAQRPPTVLEAYRRLRKVTLLYIIFFLLLLLIIIIIIIIIFIMNIFLLLII